MIQYDRKAHRWEMQSNATRSVDDDNDNESFRTFFAFTFNLCSFALFVQFSNCAPLNALLNWIRRSKNQLLAVFAAIILPFH